MWVSLIGTFLCVAVMFLMDWVTALITFAIVGVLYFYINYRKPGWRLKSRLRAFR
jgi:solute carrier family 12 sodium/potassium/chloride transporter 2